MGYEFVKLSLDTDYTQFSDFDCSYDGAPAYAKDEFENLSKYLSDPDNGAQYDLKKGLGVTRIIKKDGDLAGYFTLMSGSILLERIDEDFTDRFPFYCRTYPALKISRLAVDHKYQNIRDGDGYKVSECMLLRTLAIAERMSASVIGMRFVITDALGVVKTLKFYSDKGFRPFVYKSVGIDEKDGKPCREKQVDYRAIFRQILDGTYEKPAGQKHVGIPMYLDITKAPKGRPAKAGNVQKK